MIIHVLGNYTVIMDDSIFCDVSSDSAMIATFTQPMNKKSGILFRLRNKILFPVLDSLLADLFSHFAIVCNLNAYLFVFRMLTLRTMLRAKMIANCLLAPNCKR